MDEDIEKELILSKLDYVISSIRHLEKVNKSEIDEIVKTLISIEKDVQEY